MAEVEMDTSGCDSEPIHIPGSVQPHGLLLLVDPASATIVGGAGDLETRLTPDWLGRPISDVIGTAIPAAGWQDFRGSVLLEGTVPSGSETFDAVAHRTGNLVAIELEPRPDAAPSAGAMLGWLDNATGLFGRASNLHDLCQHAADSFRRLTGYDRVMVYRFLDDGTGEVVADSVDPKMSSFLNHHFPASDIPKQARALYVRNRVRQIPDVSYRQAPINPPQLRDTDLSDVALRSVSPIHLQYLKNMGVGASASISIVKDGLLWGLIACHHSEPRVLSYDVRTACKTMAGSLARQIRAKEEAEQLRERLKLRAGQDLLAGNLNGGDLFAPDGKGLRDELRNLFEADGLAVMHGGAVFTSGRCPPAPELQLILNWLVQRAVEAPFSSSEFGKLFAPDRQVSSAASGVLAITLSAEERDLLVWFRAERIEVINWAGNPHKAMSGVAGAPLTPRASFDAWRETVDGHARPWSLNEIEATNRIRAALLEARQTHRLQELNRQLSATLAEKDVLLRQKDFLMREVNHRVQNSIQLVGSFLNLQARTAGADTAAQLAEAARRLSAVALVHRRLYKDDNVEAVDLSRYLRELVEEMRTAMGQSWATQLTLDAAPVLVSADRAIHLGLIMTELVINANKYAYDGRSGPVSIGLEEHRDKVRLIVADRGRGFISDSKGFGTRMMQALVQQLNGELTYAENDPGLRAVVMAPIRGVAAPLAAAR